MLTVTETSMRRRVATHSVFSFSFNAVVVAIAIDWLKGVSPIPETSQAEDAVVKGATLRITAAAPIPYPARGAVPAAGK
ncbi:hypothetical protein [Streptomyces lydicus]|uniref:hypothetical protein n=1 Tax=Streptomyces lydicus TaxID=47763 RepID=UPI003419DD8D